MNISFSVLSPPVMRQASQSPSPAPGDESQLASSSTPAQAAPMLPAEHAIGLQRPTVCEALTGTREARVTVSGFGEPSSLTPLLYSEHAELRAPARSQARGGKRRHAELHSPGSLALGRALRAVVASWVERLVLLCHKMRARLRADSAPGTVG